MSNIAKHQSALARAVLTSATDFAIVTTDLAGLITSWNPGAEALLGWSEEEMLGSPADRFFTPEDRAIDRCELEMTRARETGRSEDERWHMKKDGSRLWASGLMMRFEDEDTGQHIGYLKILRDRTPQHQANEMMRESERQYRTLTEALPGLVFTTAPGGGNIYVNENYQQFVGKSFDDLMGQGWVRSLHPDDVAQVKEEWGHSVATEETSTLR